MSSSRNRSLDNKWTPEEDVVLTEAVLACGPKICWGKVASQLKGRTNKSCRKRWIHSLDPNLRKGRWTPAEDALLLTSIRKHGRHWYRVAKLLPGRTDDQCAKRWREKLDPSIRHNPWTESEDDQLVEALDKHGKRWNIISGYLKGRPAVHCRNRWLSLVRAGRVANEDGGGPSEASKRPTEVPRSTETRSTTSPQEEYLQGFDKPDKITTFGLFPASMCPPSPSTTASTPSDLYFSSLESDTRCSLLNNIDDHRAGKRNDNIDIYDPSSFSLSDFGLFNPHSFLDAGVPDMQMTGFEHFPLPPTSLDTSPTPRRFLATLDPQTAGVLDTPNSEPTSIQDVRFTWNEHIDTSAPQHSAPTFAHHDAQMDSLVVAQPTPHRAAAVCPPSQLASTPPSPPLTDNSFRMTCPLPLCAFQSQELLEIWRHITWEHVGEKTVCTKAMVELVEKVVMGNTGGGGVVAVPAGAGSDDEQDYWGNRTVTATSSCSSSVSSSSCAGLIHYY